MTALSNTATTLTTIGNREDLEGVIYRVAPEEVPFQSNVGTSKATNVKHDWQTENLANANAENAQLEGDDISSFDAPNNTVRLENICQIFRKTAVVSSTQGAVKSAGRSDEMDRQKILKGLEIKRDVEAAILGNRASQAESGSTPRKTAGALAWCTSNTSLGSGGSNGSYSGGIMSAATNGTQRVFSETLLKAVLSSTFSNGGRPSQLYMGPTQKQEFSAFTGIAQIRVDSPAGKGKQARIVGGADVYQSDFGELTAIPHPYGLTRDVLGIDPKFWGVATLRAVEGDELAKTGDAEKWLIVGEKCLVARNEKSSFAIRDLN